MWVEVLSWGSTGRGGFVAFLCARGAPEGAGRLKTSGLLAPGVGPYSAATQSARPAAPSLVRSAVVEWALVQRLGEETWGGTVL